MPRDSSRPVSLSRLAGWRRLFCILLLTSLTASPARAGFIDHLADLSDIGPAKVPSRGHSHVLVIPLELDSGRLPPLNVPEIRAFFTDDPTDRRVTFPGYWRIASAGRYTVTATVTESVRIPGCPFRGTGPSCTPARGDIRALVSGVPLVRRAILRAIEENALDLKDFDRNGPQGRPDGWIDGLILIVNGGWFGVALPFGLMRPAWGLERDGVRVVKVAIASGPRALPMSLHEFGHLLGLADLYDEWSRTYGLAFSLMGSWRYDVETPLLDAFSRMRLGWAEVEQIEGTRRVRIDPAAQGGTVYKLGDGREFFLVEARAPRRAYDRISPTSGLAVYHVNLDRAPSAEPDAYWRTVVDCPNCRTWRPFLMNVQADGRFDLQWKTRRAEAADLFRTGDALLPGPLRLRLSPSNVWFASNTYQGHPTGVSVTEIDSDSRAPAILATLSGPHAPRACARIRCPEGSRCEGGRCRVVRDALYLGSLAGSAQPAFAREATEHTRLYADPGPPATEAPPENEEDSFDWRPLSLLLLVLWFAVLRPYLKRRSRRDSAD